MPRRRNPEIVKVATIPNGWVATVDRFDRDPMGAFIIVGIRVTSTAGLSAVGEAHLARLDTLGLTKQQIVQLAWQQVRSWFQDVMPTLSGTAAAPAVTPTDPIVGQPITVP